VTEQMLVVLKGSCSFMQPVIGQSHFIGTDNISAPFQEDFCLERTPFR